MAVPVEVKEQWSLQVGVPPDVDAGNQTLGLFKGQEEVLTVQPSLQLHIWHF